MKQRLLNVKERVIILEKALLERNFDLFSEVCMRDSNDMHSICSDTFPPIFYLNDTSKLIIEFVHFINNYFNKSIVCYTFDAGPNAVLFTKDKYYMNIVIKCLNIIFNNISIYDPLLLSSNNMNNDNNIKDKILFEKIKSNFELNNNNQGIEKLILTRGGKGASIVESRIMSKL